MLSTRKPATAPSQPTEKAMCAVSAHLRTRGVIAGPSFPTLERGWRSLFVQSSGSCMSAQQGGVTVGKVGAAGEELGDRVELVGIETLQQRGHIFSYRVEDVLYVSHPLE